MGSYFFSHKISLYFYSKAQIIKNKFTYTSLFNYKEIYKMLHSIHFIIKLSQM